MLINLILIAAGLCLIVMSQKTYLRIAGLAIFVVGAQDVIIWLWKMAMS